MNNAGTSSGDVNQEVNSKVVTPVKILGDVKDAPSEVNSQVKGTPEVFGERALVILTKI